MQWVCAIYTEVHLVYVNSIINAVGLHYLCISAFSLRESNYKHKEKTKKGTTATLTGSNAHRASGTLLGWGPLASLLAAL